MVKACLHQVDLGLFICFCPDVYKHDEEFVAEITYVILISFHIMSNLIHFISIL